MVSERRQVVCLFICCLVSFPFFVSTSERIERKISDPEIIDAAHFAVNELKKLSESGIYETLQLNDLRQAASEEGVFHYNIYLNISLYSPYLKSGKPSEEYEIIVLKSWENGIKSFAIDELPEMDEDAIEEYWIRMIEQHKKKREELFRKWEKESKTQKNDNLEQNDPIVLEETSHGQQDDSGQHNQHQQCLSQVDLLDHFSKKNDIKTQKAFLSSNGKNQILSYEQYELYMQYRNVLQEEKLKQTTCSIE